MPSMTPPALTLLGAGPIENWLQANPQRLLSLVEQAYLAASEGRASNPDSYFLRFADDERNRIIALPAVLDDDHPVAGLKWVASFPDNTQRGLDRASALVLLNDRQTGYPLACLEGSLISAARTAASAVVGALQLHPTPGHCTNLGVIGCGPIAWRVIRLLQQTGWELGSVTLSDIDPQRAEQLRQRCLGLGLPARTASLESTLRESDLMLFATSAVRPGIDQPDWFAHAPTVLHLSLRDLAPAVVLRAQNLADNVDHCLKAATSLELAWQQAGHRDFIAGDIVDALQGRVQPDPRRARIFSPFGMGVLDLAVARAIYQDCASDQGLQLEDFFARPYQAA
ncbi:2,3-diaminopropionate biosynthesis protein SbnB [Pseudomonas fontis]|uniref:2,3-diaminopropionate biosynthesis protein SbnB n=1 Tax=Pseudomonas fontis TaxID=2942633 RepID=A0ABT5NXW4_9PSED|nr:2,3-diaminopropionate biosynthesis protein SbnB [Pseudomonas fontis]MDD0972511.1 2,3-diaminopropionate biosynthesis protein SbnB [Pseudomonas fontis]MDD0993035.1 2,3-diaminopropionate biosynthesis protein SbnB [Pseudomonas fontis]